MDAVADPERSRALVRGAPVRDADGSGATHLTIPEALSLRAEII